MLLDGGDKGAVTPSVASASESNTRAAQGALMGVALLYTAGGKEMPELLKAALFMAGIAGFLINVDKIRRVEAKK